MAQKKYTLEYKCQCISFHLKNLKRDPKTSFTNISKRLNLDRRVFTRCIKNKNKIMLVKTSEDFSRVENKDSKSISYCTLNQT